MIEEGQPWADPAARSVDSTQDDREPLATSTAFVHTRVSTSGFLFFLNGRPVSIGAKTQTLTA